MCLLCLLWLLCVCMSVEGDDDRVGISIEASLCQSGGTCLASCNGGRDWAGLLPTAADERWQCRALFNSRCLTHRYVPLPVRFTGMCRSQCYSQVCACPSAIHRCVSVQSDSQVCACPRAIHRYVPVPVRFTGMCRSNAIHGYVPVPLQFTGMCRSQCDSQACTAPSLTYRCVLRVLPMFFSQVCVDVCLTGVWRRLKLAWLPRDVYCFTDACYCSLDLRSMYVPIRPYSLFDLPSSMDKVFLNVFAFYTFNPNWT